MIFPPFVFLRCRKLKEGCHKDKWDIKKSASVSGRSILVFLNELLDANRIRGIQTRSSLVRSKGGPLGKVLTTYLQDHLAGAMHAIELLKAIRDHYAGKPLGQFASELLIDIEADRNVLARLTENTGGASGGPKEWASWLAEKVSRLKLKHDSGDGLGTFEALESSCSGSMGKGRFGLPWRLLPLTTLDYSGQISGLSLRARKISTQGWRKNDSIAHASSLVRSAAL
jgi:hypothetical protein